MGAARIGVDVGGTKIEAVRVRLGGESPEVLERKRVPTPRSYEGMIEAARALIEEIDGGDRLPVGIGMPGSITRAGVVKNSNTTFINGRPFRQDLTAALGGEARRVGFANDANCFALAEATWGAARGANLVFGVIMGTGVGGGIVLRGEDGALRVWDGLHGIAGEWGHTMLDAERGLPCYCGRRGCVEMYLAGPAIERAYAARTGSQLPLADIPEGDPLIAERMDLFGRALAQVIDVLDPDLVVLGGGVSNLDALYTQGRAAVAKWVFSDELLTPVVKNTLGDSAGVLGAALLPG